MIAGDSGCRVISCTTPPSAELPYKLEVPPRNTSTLESATRGTRSQYTQPPNGSTSGMPSTITSARLDALPPRPRRETPWADALAVRLPERRNNEKPGTWRSKSSTRRAGFAVTSCAESRIVLPGVSASRISERAAETTTCSFTRAGCKVISRCTASSPLLLHGSSTEAKPSLPIETVPFPPGPIGIRIGHSHPFWSMPEMSRSAVGRLQTSKQRPWNRAQLLRRSDHSRQTHQSQALSGSRGKRQRTKMDASEFQLSLLIPAALA